jgi:hypothetical protein
MRVEEVKKHTIDTELADILGLTEAERLYVTYFLSGQSQYDACQMVAKTLKIKKANWHLNTRSKQYIAVKLKETNEVLKRKGEDELITLSEIVQHLTEMATDKENEEGRVRVKSLELLLKWRNGLSKHNESRASKTLIAVQNMSDDEFVEKLKKLKETHVPTYDLDELNNTTNQPQLIDLGQLSEQDVYGEYEEVNDDEEDND